MPHQPAERKAIRARSRSTTMRVATLWTRPADSRGMIFFHRTGRDLVAVEAVEDPAGLLGVDQPAVEVPPLEHRPLDGRPGDLVEDHPLDRHPGGQHLEEVPGDGLALAVLVRGQVDLAGLLDQRFNLVTWAFFSVETT